MSRQKGDIMREILISIQPKWVEKIVSGEKTVEVRKTRPKCETPFKCYIYETRNGGHRCKNCEQKDDCYSYAPLNVGCYNGRGRVIGHFICDKIVEFPHDLYDPAFSETADLSCVGIDGLSEYLGHKDYGYGWHITNLVVYDEPRELSEFTTPEWFRDCKKQCDSMEYMRCPTKDSRKVDKMCGWCRKGGDPITRPPMSWQFCVATEKRQTADTE